MKTEEKSKLAPVTYEYGAMSSKFSCKAENKLTAYVTMVMHYDSQAHLLVIYSPEECKKDCWMSITGNISDRLDEIFGGIGSFDEYVKNHIEEIRACYKSIRRHV
jgi:hypothetical protein